MLALTLIKNVPVADAPLSSVACKANVVSDALQVAVTSAVIVPPVLVRLETVTPFDGFALVIATETLPAGVKSSETVAIVRLAVLPCSMVLGVGVTTGGILAAQLLSKTETLLLL